MKLLGKDVWYDEDGNEHVTIKGSNTYINGIMEIGKTNLMTF